MSHLRKLLSAKGLYNLVRSHFKGIKEPKKIQKPKRNRTPIIYLEDCLMSGLAVFSLKYPSLLQFEDDKSENSLLQHNLKMLFGVNQAPCDTQMRERLDNLDPTHSLLKGANSCLTDGVHHTTQTFNSMTDFALHEYIGLLRYRLYQYFGLNK